MWLVCERLAKMGANEERSHNRRNQLPFAVHGDEV
jgi:hypothetical protein